MKAFFILRHCLVAFFLAGGCLADAAPLINEIFYRPGTGYPENRALEFIEIYNPEAVSVDLSGWAITSGAAYTFPSGTVIAAGGYRVVVADVSAFQSAYPAVTAPLGPWAAGAALADRGEKITLSKPGVTAGSFATVDSVSYADEGDWAVRTRDSLGGWSWVTGANGAGKSLEQRNPGLDGDNGQNWGDSAAMGGSPGAANSLLSTNIAPLIIQVRHWPAVPKSTEAVTISCQLADEAATSTLMATLFYRNATTPAPAAFQSLAMIGDGTGFFSATLPAMADKTIVEFYLLARDATLARTWPGATSEGQNANCQYQVDNEVVAGTAPLHRLVLTAAENAAYAAVAANSNRQFNVTFVATRGDDPTIRYRSSIRNRGQSSRNYTYRPIRVSFPTDDRWDGASDFALNPKFPWNQFIGMRLLQAAGLAGGDASPVELRLNGVERTVSGTSGDYGRWARIEDIGGDYVEKHWPAASGGQVYRAEGMSSYWPSTGAAPTNPDTLWNGWSKQSAHALNAWTQGSASFGITNAGLALPWTTGTPLALSPAGATLMEGEFLGYFTLAQPSANARLTATASTSQTGSSTALVVGPVLADSDSDGIPDAWEAANGLIIGTNDATLDPDGDGALNRAEYLAGTSPQSRASHLAITAMGMPAAGRFEVTWPAIAGKLYRVVASADLSTWEPLSMLLPAVSGSQTVTLTTEGAARLFIRVEILPAP